MVALPPRPTTPAAGAATPPPRPAPPLARPASPTGPTSTQAKSATEGLTSSVFQCLSRTSARSDGAVAPQPACTAMALPALCLAVLLSAATAVPHQNFYYQAATYQPPYQPVYQPAYQPRYQPVYQQAYQPAYQVFQHQPYNQHVLPIPLAHQYIPAIPTHPIYSEQAKSQQGYSYETEDVAGGHAQVIYVSGPNSQKIFQQSLKTLHFAVPIYSVPAANQTGAATVTEPATTTESEAVTEAAPEAAPTTTPAPVVPPQPDGLPQIDYTRVQVLAPHTRIVVGELPLFAYSFLHHPLQSNVPAAKASESLDNGGNTTSTTEEPAESKQETEAEKSDASTTLSPSSEESNSSSSSDFTSNSSSNDNDSQTMREENSTEENESATEAAEKTDS